MLVSVMSFENPTVPFDCAGYDTVIPAGWSNFGNQWAYFTTWANALTGATCLALALRPRTTSQLLKVLRIASLVNIAVTFIVSAALPVGGTGTGSLAATAEFFQHMLNPILAWVCLVVAPALGLTARRALLALSVPVVWMVVTIVRGVLIDWYPYSFIDVSAIGYGAAVLNYGAVIVVWFVLALVVVAVDRLKRRGRIDTAGERNVAR
ncbi:hypothetical protein CH267_06875 [Rhodococcus sp. 06-621-2]|nr:hypothetical protein CH267_06875 [Rhodococcus sp. 06-621-2]